MGICVLRADQEQGNKQVCRLGEPQEHLRRRRNATVDLQVLDARADEGRSRVGGIPELCGMA